ncbi:MAG TPA: hypothetical protein VI757_01515 [Bacteroidia bacterium]|nr:hypothetical protein [Bacteroidia bacterium]
MNQTHIHLLLNHAPIMGTAFGAALFFYGLFRKNSAVVDASLLAFAVTALVAIPVFLTGEPAEESIENIQGIVKSAIETHEENAEVAFWLMEALGLFSLVTFFVRRKENKMAIMLTNVSLIFSLVVFGFMVRVGNDGGKIRHPEMSNEVVNAAQPNEQGTNESGKEDEEESD